MDAMSALLSSVQFSPIPSPQYCKACLRNMHLSTPSGTCLRNMHLSTPSGDHGCKDINNKSVMPRQQGPIIFLDLKSKRVIDSATAAGRARRQISAMGKKLLEAAAIGRWLKSLKSRRNSKQVHDEDKMHDESTQNDSEESYNDRRVGVYYGQLPDGKQIAVKRLCKQKFRSAIKFSAEIEKLGHLRHKNILHIQGYCSERNEKIIVYDYMPNACLLAHLHGGFSYDSHLSWNTRIMIARGCAEGLLYLHHHANPRVVHGNLKASNIVLNAKYEPLLSDYGLASIMNESSKAGQLSGYEAPERLHNALEKMCLTEKSDVFSFGIILLVLITGRRPYEKSELLKREYIVDWVEPLVLGGELEKLLDQRISHNFVQTELELLVHVAIICAQAKPENRPTMLEVVQLLHAAV